MLNRFGTAPHALCATHEMHGPWLIHQHALFAGTFAVVLDAPISIMADAAGLANYQVSRDQASFQPGSIFAIHAIVM